MDVECDRPAVAEHERIAIDVVEAIFDTKEHLGSGLSLGHEFSFPERSLSRLCPNVGFDPGVRERDATVGRGSAAAVAGIGIVGAMKESSM